MSLEPVFMSDPAYAEICAKVIEGYPNACVCYMDRVVNPMLEARYMDYVRSQGDRPVDEKLLFHGTAEANIQTIVREGFKAAYNRVSAYGLGTYLATRADYSKTYAPPASDGLSFMFVCRAAIGRSCRGIPNKPIPFGFDVGVDNAKNPTIYVMPNDDSVLPQYVIAFHMNA